MPPHLGWLRRSVLAGTAGTATMTAAYALERRLRPRFKMLATSLGTHAADVLAVAGVDDRVRRARV